MRHLALKNKKQLSLFCIFIIVLTLSFYSPLGKFTATPKFWRDEAIPFEISRTFLELGKLDVVVAPGVVDGRPYLTHATGFPLTVPLAGFFWFFGIGVAQARIFMVLWIVATIFALFFILRDFFGDDAAIFGTLLVSTFAPFYANGRTTTGEIPGFLFFLIALWFLYKKERYVLGGMFLALAAVTKPSVFLLVFPALAIEFLISERGVKRLLQSFARCAAGILPILALWIAVILPQPFRADSWKAMISLYRNPFYEPLLFSRFPAALPEFLGHSTVIYFGAIFVILVAAFWYRAFRGNQARWTTFLFAYAAMSIIYFLRSPGWLRYLLISELLALSSLYPAISFFTGAKKKIAVGIIAVLAAIHLANFFLFSDIQSGTASIETAEFINSKFLASDTLATIGVIYMPTVAPLISSWRKYQIATIGGNDTYGENPLMFPEERLPTYIIGFENEGKETLEKFYKPYVEAPNGYMIYKKQ